MRKATRHFDWKGRIETLEDRRVMSADPLLGGSIEHHAFLEEEAPQIEHQLVSEPDFWLDVDNLISLEDQLDQIEQTLYSAHGTTGLNSVVSNYGFTGIGQTVAVIDSGIAYDHFALGGGFGSNYKVVGGWDFTGENDANPYDDGPSGSHGTHVAGIVGGTSGNDKGVAPGVDLVALRVFDDAGSGYFSWVENALRWVINNRTTFENPITAINLSLGVSSWNSNTIPAWSTLEDEFASLKAAGVFIAVSAGNGYATFNAPGLSYPAASPHVVPVMSVTDSGALASYSQRDTRAIAAPGSAIRSTVPDYNSSSSTKNNGITDDYANFSGTSMASPYIAGASVLIRQAMEFAGYTSITQDTIYNHMMATGTAFLDASTGLTFKRLNLGAAINALMPTDEYGSTVATAHNLGSLNNTQSLDGVIGTVSDADYFSFTATSNGRVTFDVSDATHNMDAAWTLSAGTGTVSNNGDTFAFDVVAGQTYTVGLSSSGGIGHYSLEVSAENTFTYTDWGSVSFSQLNGLSATGESWYRVAASQTGYLTVESLFDAQSGQVSLQLYNANMQPVMSGNSVNGTSRVDTYATAGQEFYVCVLGSNAEVDYRLSNLVTLDGTTVNIDGTTGDDAFVFSAGDTHTVTVNGVTHTFSSTAVNAFHFNGGAGSDTITTTGTAGNETARLDVGQLSVTGTGYSVLATSVENITANGGGGFDVANFYDSSGDDRFIGRTTYSYLQGTGYSNYVAGFTQVHAFSTNGGNDEANLYDSAGDDRFYGHSSYAYLRTGQFYNYAAGFDRVHAFALNGGYDEANLYDSAGNDQFYGYSTYAYMRSNQFLNYAGGFDRVHGFALNGGYDEANLYDSAGNDKFYGHSTYAYMQGDQFFNYIQGFDRVHGFALNGGYDEANLYDSAGNDRLYGHSTYAYMQGGQFFNYAQGFERVHGFALNGGYDEANLYDSAGNDQFYGYSTYAYMQGGQFFNYAQGFDRVHGFALNGGVDEAKLYDSAGNERFFGYSTYAYMQGDQFFNYTAGFDQVLGYALNGGDDEANFYDSAGDDRFYGYSTNSYMRGNQFLNYAAGFDRVHGFALNGGYDEANLYDSAGNDQFYGHSTYAYMRGSQFLSYAGGFDRVHGFALNGGYDEANLYDSAGNDKYYGYSTYAYMQGGQFFNYAGGFDRVHGFALNGGYDEANLYDSAGDDQFVASSNYSHLSGNGFFNYVSNFDRIDGYSNSGGVDRATFINAQDGDTTYGRGNYFNYAGAFAWWSLTRFDWISVEVGSDDDVQHDVLATDYVFEEIGVA
jgi:hypothetical protein